MPARRNARSEVGKPAGSMMCASTPRHAARRRIVPLFCGISGSNNAIRMAEASNARLSAIMTEIQGFMRLLVIVTQPFEVPTCTLLARVPIKRRWIRPLGLLLAASLLQPFGLQLGCCVQDGERPGSPAAARRCLRVGRRRN